DRRRHRAHGTLHPMAPVGVDPLPRDAPAPRKVLPMRRLFALPLLLLLSSAAHAGSVAWRGWNDGLSAAAGAGKPLVVDVYTDWCGWCKRMDRDVYAKEAVSDYVNAHFVMVRLNAESAEKVSYAGRTVTARGLAGAFQVTGYPTTIFLRPDGTHMVNVPG